MKYLSALLLGVSLTLTGIKLGQIVKDPPLPSAEAKKIMESLKSGTGWRLAANDCNSLVNESANLVVNGGSLYASVTTFKHPNGKDEAKASDLRTFSYSDLRYINAAYDEGRQVVAREALSKLEKKAPSAQASQLVCSISNGTGWEIKSGVNYHPYLMNDKAKLAVYSDGTVYTLGEMNSTTSVFLKVTGFDDDKVGIAEAFQRHLKKSVTANLDRAKRNDSLARTSTD